MEAMTDGRILVRCELETILMQLNEALAANDRRRAGEPISDEIAVRVLTAHQRLGYMTKILLAGTLLLFLTFLFAKVAHLASERVHPDAQTIRNPTTP